MDAGVSCAGRSLCWVPTYPPEYMHVCVCVHACVHARVHVHACTRVCVCVCTLQISEPAHLSACRAP